MGQIFPLLGGFALQIFIDRVIWIRSKSLRGCLPSSLSLGLTASTVGIVVVKYN